MDNEVVDGDWPWNGYLRLRRRLGVFRVDYLGIQGWVVVVSIYRISCMKSNRLWLRTIDLITHRSLFYLSLRTIQNAIPPSAVFFSPSVLSVYSSNREVT
jgi:hypothetical protein